MDHTVSRSESSRRASRAAPVIEVSEATKRYGDVLAVDRVEQHIEAGEIYGLLGLNGAGKTTLIRMLLGLVRPTSGRVALWGEPVRAGSTGIWSSVGYLVETATAYPELTVRENLLVARRLRHLRTDREVGAVIELLRLGEYADRRAGTLSLGNTQRLGLARAMLHRPDLLILDEPLSGMDPIMRRKTIRMIREWARSGKSVLVSSHILHEIESMTSNILLINNGRILAEGDVHQIRDLIDEHPHTVYVRANDPRRLARQFLESDDVLSMRFESGAVVVETAKPDTFYARLTDMAASGEFGAIDEVTSPDDNLQAVFQYLVKS